MKWCVAVGAFLLATFIGCETSRPPVPVPGNNSLCALESTTEKLNRPGTSIQFPNIGKIVIESHLRTNDETYGGPGGFPTTATSGINEHLARHEGYLRLFGVSSAAVYVRDFEREWTPAEEGGVYGQGSEASLPSIEEETFGANLPWKAGHPSRAPENWLIQNPANNRSVIVRLGYESGPTFSSKFIAGAQPAVHFFVGADNDTQLVIGKLKDQSLPLGPVECD